MYLCQIDCIITFQARSRKKHGIIGVF